MKNNIIKDIEKEFKVKSNKFELLPYEVFVLIDNIIMKNIKPCSYYVSNYGRVYSTLSGKFLKSKVNVKTKYLEFTLRKDDGKPLSVNIHRLLMKAFQPLESYENMVVNHKDGNKLNNSMSNLEWTTYKGNSRHAVSVGLYHPAHGEKHVCARITEVQCHEICEMLQSGKYRMKEIADKMKIPVYIVDSIKNKKAWVEISDQYDVTFQKERVSRIFTFEELNKICEYFQENSKSDDESMAKYIKRGLKKVCPDKTETTHVNSIRKLYKKERWKYIYQNYDY